MVWRLLVLLLMGWLLVLLLLGQLVLLLLGLVGLRGLGGKLGRIRHGGDAAIRIGSSEEVFAMLVEGDRGEHEGAQEDEPATRSAARAQCRNEHREELTSPTAPSRRYP